jgi:acetolactate synthase-1/2/3 large subunit
MKYSDYLMQCLEGLGFTHVFYVAGGNSMHLLESASRYFECIPVVHEVTACIATEYFNESGGRKAFALVTAGPGLTNTITGIAGAWLESHELLVIGGQVKSSNLKSTGSRQGGIQEIDGVGLVAGITKKAVRIEKPMVEHEIAELVNLGKSGRKGPIFLEICLDVSATEFSDVDVMKRQAKTLTPSIEKSLSFDFNLDQIRALIQKSSRPLILLGNGISRTASKELLEELAPLRIPVATTWSGADRIGFDYPFYAGRPNTFGMRWANIFQQQADLLIVVGSSLGLQQTGFNTAGFLPAGAVIHVDIDEPELKKLNPKSRLAIQMDCTDFAKRLPAILAKDLSDISEWVNFLAEIRQTLPTLEDTQKSSAPYISPHEAINALSQIVGETTNIVICSSGGTFTAGLQCFENKTGQILLSNKGLASMGYGMAGAIGVAIQNPGKQTLLFEGDGGFAQNLQDLGTISVNRLRIKMFITNNRGYASIRTSQQNYFDGHYLGCDTETGLGFPNWRLIAASYKLEHFLVTSETFLTPSFMSAFTSETPTIFEIVADPEQSYLPKVSSAINLDGTMTSTPIHDMIPRLDSELLAKVFRYIPAPE